MHRPLAVFLAIRLWFAFHTLKVDALATAPQGFITTAVNQTKSPSIRNLILPHSRLNEIFISYHVPNSPTTLVFHVFGPAFPPDELLRAIAFAVGIVYDEVADQGGRAHIISGYFVYHHESTDRKVVEITVGDFRDIGLLINYDILLDKLGGWASSSCFESIRLRRCGLRLR